MMPLGQQVEQKHGNDVVLASLVGIAYRELAAPVLMVRPPGTLAERAKDIKAQKS